MNDTPQNPATKLPSHLRGSMIEVMAGLRVEAMDLLVAELILAFSMENYQFDEFLHALAGHCESQGWDEVVRCLESAAENVVKIQRQSEGLPPK